MFLIPVMLTVACTPEPQAQPQPQASAPTTVSEPVDDRLAIYDLSLNSETVKKGQEVRFCFKARNALSISGGPGKFLNNGNPEGDCLVHIPQSNTVYNISFTGLDGSQKSRMASVSVRQN